MKVNYLKSRVIPEGATVSRFALDVEIANNDDMVDVRKGNLSPDKVRRMTIQGVIDSGAARLVLPGFVVEKLGIPLKKKKVRVRYADGRRALRQETEGVLVRLLDRDSVFYAIVEPKRKTVLIGALVLESLDLLVDCLHEKLVPRDPKYIFSEIE